MKRQIIHVAALAGITFGVPLALEPAFAAADQQIKADQVIEGCHWSDTAGQWIYPEGSLCRGTGEDPTTDGHGWPVCANGRLDVWQDNGRVTCIDTDSDEDAQQAKEDTQNAGHHGHGHSHKAHHETENA